MMMEDVKEYMSTAEVARDLSLSIGTVQKLVEIGKLKAVRTQGGHRRIFMKSLDDYKKNHGYTMTLPVKKSILILHSGNDLDPTLTQNNIENIKVMTHPLGLLGLDENFDVLFIDARNQWLQTMPEVFIDDIMNKYNVFFYNCDELNNEPILAKIDCARLIPDSLSLHFVFGYIAGRKLH